MSVSSRAKYQADAPANAGQSFVAAEDKAEGNARKHYHGRHAKPKGRSGKGHVKTPHRRGGRSRN